MARPLRLEFPGAVYHITSRGNAKQTIFLDDKDYTQFLAILCSVVEGFNWLLHVYCLMGNHYHLLIETIEGNLSRGMRQLNGVYTQQFNRRHNRTGHVLQGRYKAIFVDKDNYLLELCRYIVLNPVRAGLVKSVNEWKFSSYRGTSGCEKGIPCLTTDWVLSRFGNNREEASLRYKEFVYAGLKGESPMKEVKGQLFLGSERFIKKFRRLLNEKGSIKEIPRVQRYLSKPLLEEIIPSNIKDKALYRKLLYEAHMRYGYTLREIAEYCGVHCATISRAVRQASAPKNDIARPDPFYDPFYFILYFITPFISFIFESDISIL